MATIHSATASRANNRLPALVAAVVFTGFAVFVLGVSRATHDDWRLLLTLCALGALAERYAVGLFHSDVSVGAVAVLAAAVVCGAWGVAVVAPVIVLAGQYGTHAVWYKRLYNVAVYLLAGGAFAAVFSAFSTDAGPDDWPAVLVPALLGALANFVINTGLVSAAVAMSSDERMLDHWRRTYQWLAPQYLVVGLTAVALATGYQVMGLWGLAVFAAPVAGLRQAYVQGSGHAPPQETELPRAA